MSEVIDYEKYLQEVPSSQTNVKKVKAQNDNDFMNNWVAYGEFVANYEPEKGIPKRDW